VNGDPSRPTVSHSGFNNVTEQQSAIIAISRAVESGWLQQLGVPCGSAMRVVDKRHAAASALSLQTVLACDAAAVRQDRASFCADVLAPCMGVTVKGLCCGGTEGESGSDEFSSYADLEVYPPPPVVPVYRE
jgi:hypothetical protein